MFTPHIELIGFVFASIFITKVAKNHYLIIGKYKNCDSLSMGFFWDDDLLI